MLRIYLDPELKFDSITIILQLLLVYYQLLLVYYHLILPFLLSCVSIDPSVRGTYPLGICWQVRIKLNAYLMR